MLLRHVFRALFLGVIACSLFLIVVLEVMSQRICPPQGGCGTKMSFLGIPFPLLKMDQGHSRPEWKEASGDYKVRPAREQLSDQFAKGNTNVVKIPMKGRTPRRDPPDPHLIVCF